MLLAAAAVGLGAILLGLGRQPMPASGPATMTIGTEAPLLRRLPALGLALAFTLLLAALVMRAILIGHAPWSNLHEFSLAFAAALIGTHLLLGRAHPTRRPCAVHRAACRRPGRPSRSGWTTGVDPLVPALQQPLLLTIHVGAAVLAYAVSGVAFIAAAAEIGQARSGDRIPILPSAAAARAIGHRAVLVAFPILTIAIALGSVWANLAWRSYWSNDPKELAAAATWLVFGAYLHVAGRRDRWERLAPWLIVLGFAGVLFTYIGAGLFFIGEHSYAAP